MLDGTARSGHLLPVTDWAVLFSSPAASPAVSSNTVITLSATASAAQSETPICPPAVLEAACQAAASPADPKVASAGPLLVAKSACSAESEDVYEGQEGLEWLFGPPQPQQQVYTATAGPADCQFACLLQCTCLTCTACHGALLHWGLHMFKPLTKLSLVKVLDTIVIQYTPSCCTACALFVLLDANSCLARCCCPRMQASATKTRMQHEDQESQHQAAGFAVPAVSADEARVVASSSSAQPATHAAVPQALLDLAVQSGESKNQPPQFQHILTSVYARGVAKPKRRPDDKIPTCICPSHRAGAGFWSASAIGRVARRQSGRHLGLEAAAAASTAAASTACLPSESSDVPHVDLADGPDLCCEVTDIDVEQAMRNVDHFVSCLSMEDPEGSSLPVQQSLLPSTPFGTGWASSLSQNKWHQNAAAQQQAGCGDKCLNRQLCVLCDAKLCPCGTECSNRCTPLALSWYKLPNAHSGPHPLMCIT